MVAKAPRPGTTRAKETARLSIAVDGDVHVFTPSALTAAQVGQCRRQTGRTVRALLDEMQTDPDIDTIAAFVWLAKLQRGDDATYADVVDSIGYGTDLEAEAETGEPDDGEDDSPEA